MAEINAKKGLSIEPQASTNIANNSVFIDSGDSYLPKLKDNSGNVLRVITLDSSGKLPAVNGSQLTNIPSPNVSDWTPLFYTGFTSDGEGIYTVSPTEWGTGSKVTLDAGGTWANYTIGSPSSSSIIAKFDATYLVNVTSTGSTKYNITGNADGWVAGGSLASVTVVKDISYPTANLIVVVGDASSGVGTWFSTDQGVSFTQSTTGQTGGIYAVDMYDGTNGMLVSNGGRVYYTTDGAVNWTDSGFNASSGDGWAMLSLSATEYIASKGEIKDSAEDFKGIYKGDTTSAGVLVMNCSIDEGMQTNFCRTTNGNIYLGVVGGSRDATGRSSQTCWLFRSTDEGDHWSMKNIGFSYNWNDGLPEYPSTLIEYDTNKMLMKFKGGMIVKIDES